MNFFYEKLNNFEELAQYIRDNTMEQIKQDVGFATLAHQDKEKRTQIKLPNEPLIAPPEAVKALDGTFCYAFASPFENTASVSSFLIHLKNHIEKFAASYLLMADDISRDTFFYILLFRMMPYDIRFLEKVRCHGYEYYQKELLPQEEGGVLLDCGAYDGLTAKEFEQAYGKYKRIYSFEPVPENFQLLEENTKDMEDLVRLNKGVGQKADVIRFLVARDGSRSHCTGEIEVPVVRIDDEITEPVTFVKMDIEGMEMAALKGAETRLVADRPFLAICVYHLISDFHKIPLYLDQLLPDYQFRFRHHGDLNWKAPQYGTVLYGCPKEKLP